MFIILRAQGRTLKEILIKLISETGNNWVSLLLPYSEHLAPLRSKVSPLLKLFGKPPSLTPKLGEEQIAEVPSQVSTGLATYSG